MIIAKQKTTTRGGNNNQNSAPRALEPRVLEGRENCSPDPVSEKCSFTSWQKHLSFLPGRREMKQKTEDKDTAREASEGD